MQGGKLLRALGSPENILSASAARLREFRLSDENIAHLRAKQSDVVDHASAWLKTPHSGFITITDPGYPTRLHELSDPPLGLFYLGDPEVLQTKQLAIVGSRNPSPAGQRHARLFAKALAQQGLVITSGLAMGIDAAAHEGALAAQGLTLAVTGTGLDTVYPHSHQDLAARIAQDGLLISEFPPGTPPKRQNFPRRNRLISALSLGTLVVEAAMRSGSLITARLASEQGREVFAIPGSVDNPLARGCHALIRNGAKLVETAQDILEELGPIIDNGAIVAVATSKTSAAKGPTQDGDYQLLLEHLDNAPMSIDALAAASGLSVNSISSMLLILELQGAVAIAPGGGFQRC